MLRAGRRLIGPVAATIAITPWWTTESCVWRKSGTAISNPARPTSVIHVLLHEGGHATAAGATAAALSRFSRYEIVSAMLPNAHRPILPGGV